MSNDASWQLNLAIKLVLNDDDQLKNCFEVSTVNNVVDTQSSNTFEKGFVLENPRSNKSGHIAFINIGKVRTQAWKSASFEGQSHDIHIIITHLNHCNDSVNKAVSRIISLLHDGDLVLKKNAVVELQFEWSETSELKDGGWQADLCFHILTVGD